MRVDRCIDGLQIGHRLGVACQGIGRISERLPELIEDASNELPRMFRLLIQLGLTQSGPNKAPRRRQLKGTARRGNAAGGVLRKS